MLSEKKHAKGLKTKASLVFQWCNWNWFSSQSWMTLHLFIKHLQKPVKFAEISDADIIFIDNYN